MNTTLELLNYEGPVLLAELTEFNTVLIFDQWKNPVAELTKQELIDFFDGELDIMDSEGNEWNFENASEDARPLEIDMIHFLDSF